MYKGDLCGLQRCYQRIDPGEVSAGLIRSKRARGYSNYSGIKQRSCGGTIVSDKGVPSTSMPRDATLPTTIEIRIRRLRNLPSRRQSKDRSLSLLPPPLSSAIEHLLRVGCLRSAAMPCHRTSSFHLGYASQTGSQSTPHGGIAMVIAVRFRLDMHHQACPYTCMWIWRKDRSRMISPKTSRIFWVQLRGHIWRSPCVDSTIYFRWQLYKIFAHFSHRK